jgi:hypothetical protein
MKKASLFLTGVLMVLFCLHASDGRQEEQQISLTMDPVLIWSTILSQTGMDFGSGIAVDTSGNIYVIGKCVATWGSPVNPYSGDDEAFVAKLDANGVLQWNTFLGGSKDDYGYGIAVDATGDIYVTGSSFGTWGSPVRAFSENPVIEIPDAFVAKLDGNGVLQWNTFLGATSDDLGWGIAVDTSGDSYVTGWSGQPWGVPLLPFIGGLNAFVAKLDANGSLEWNTFLGRTIGQRGQGIATDANGKIYVTGTSSATWGSPINPFSGDTDASVAKLDGNGALAWNTFLGQLGDDRGMGIAVDTSGHIYMTGQALGDPFVAKLAGNGVLQWNTFLDQLGDYIGSGIAVDTSGDSYVTGSGSGGDFVAKLDGNGVPQWNSFLSATEVTYGISMDTSRNAYVTGSRIFSSFVAKISTQQQYSFYGFDQPIENTPAVNNAKAGSSIPVKWQITDPDGAPISDSASFKSLTSYSVSCGAFSVALTDEVEEHSAGDSGLQYLGGGYWQFNWKTLKSYSGQCRIMVLKLADGSEHTAYFHFR